MNFVKRIEELKSHSCKFHKGSMYPDPLQGGAPCISGIVEFDFMLPSTFLELYNYPNAQHPDNSTHKLGGISQYPEFPISKNSCRPGFHTLDPTHKLFKKAFRLVNYLHVDSARQWPPIGIIYCDTPYNAKVSMIPEGTLLSVGEIKSDAKGEAYVPASVQIINRDLFILNPHVSGMFIELKSDGSPIELTAYWKLISH